MRMRTCTAGAIVALALAASPALAQTPTSPSPSTAVVQPPSTELRASKLIGTTVKNSANESIGSINEVVLSNDGKVAAVVIGVGGFLGMGEREVAVNYDSLRLSRDSNDKTVVALDATKDSLKAAPEWRWIGDRTGTTGNGSAPTRQPVAK